MKLTYVILCLLFSLSVHAQSFVVRDIKSFGARGDGRTNDHAAFQKAAEFFNKRKGNGKLIISKGNYLVGRQTFVKNPTGARSVYEGQHLLDFWNLTNFTLQGTTQSVITYIRGLRYGAFDPQTGKPYEHGNNYFVNGLYAAYVGNAVQFNESSNITITQLELNGSNQSLIYGGVYGDKGRQLQHIGICLIKTRLVNITNVKAHHFGMDGIIIANVPHPDGREDSITISRSAFEYNGRQGMSWIGGKGLTVKDCKFNFTGRGKTMSPPGAGVDIEAESGPITGGRFLRCEFVDNIGCSLLADAGDSRNCTFDSCTFWGVDAWSIWVHKPAFTFRDCRIYGSIIHGYNAPTNEEATRFIRCVFEDRPLDGRGPYGNFLIESNYMRRVRFENCTMIAHRKKWCWLMQDPKWSAEERYQLVNCRFIMTGAVLPQNDFSAVIRGIRYRNTTFEYQSPEARKKNYYLNECCDIHNIDEGGNRILFK